MAREDVENALLNQEPGVFLMRFSERHHGQFAIAYTGSNIYVAIISHCILGTERPSKIKHYLVQPNEYVLTVTMNLTISVLRPRKHFPIFYKNNLNLQLCWVSVFYIWCNVFSFD